MVRGSGKFKQKRGGGRSFSKEMTFDNAESARNAKKAEGIEEESSEEEEEEEEEESESEEEENDDKPEMTRAERRELKKQGKVKETAKAKKEAGSGEENSDDDDDLINPNHVQKKLTISDLSKPRELSRKEREAKEAKEKQDRYWKLHQAGKTDEAKSDLARLAKIRAEREVALAKRKAEADAKQAEITKAKELQQQKRKV